MRRLFGALESRQFDLLVVGGGITGAGIARDAAMRGLSVAIVDKGDWASGTSSRSSRLVHGGIRYLEHGQIGMVRESVRERGILLRIAPDLVKPLEFIWPVYSGARIPAWKLRTGLTMYDALAGREKIRRHVALTRTEVLQIEPRLAESELVGGARYFDAATDDARLALANVLSAVDNGAVAVNYATAGSTTVTSEKVDGAVVHDGLGGATARVSARVVVRATGPWQALGTKGSHISLPRERVGNRGAVTMMSPDDGRVMFVLPAGTQTIIGTTDTFTGRSADGVRASAAEIAYMLRAANAAFPSAELREDDVIAAWAGIRPLALAPKDRKPSRISREHRITETGSGEIVVSGGKLTTYRSMAAEVVEHAGRILGVEIPECSTGRVELPSRAPRRSPDLETGQASAESHRVIDGLPYTFADVDAAVREEMAVTIADILIRRTHIGFETRDHGVSVTPVIARVMGDLLGWDRDTQNAAVEAYVRDAEQVFGIEDGEEGERV